MILDKMYQLLIDDIRQKINDDLAKTIDERDAQYHLFFKKIELMTQKIHELHLKVNTLSKFDRGNIEQYISDNQRLINSYSEGVHNVYKEFQDFRKDTIAAFVNLGVTVDRLDQSNKQQSIKELNTCVRTTNCLLAENIYTVGYLCNCTERDLLKIPNFGKRCLLEVKNLLAGLGLKLKDC